MDVNNKNAISKLCVVFHSHITPNIWLLNSLQQFTAARLEQSLNQSEYKHVGEPYYRRCQSDRLFPRKMNSSSSKIYFVAHS